MKQNEKDVGKALRILELNLKKLADVADHSFNIRDFVYANEYSKEFNQPIYAAVKGIMNETRANKFCFNDSFRKDQFTFDLRKIRNAVLDHELKLPHIKRRKINQKPTKPRLQGEIEPILLDVKEHSATEIIVGQEAQ